MADDSSVTITVMLNARWWVWPLLVMVTWAQHLRLHLTDGQIEKLANFIAVRGYRYGIGRDTH